MRIFALLPAAGKSTRMGRPKLALALGERTVLECVLETLKTAGIEHILLVLGPHVTFLRPMAEQAGARVLLLDQETPDMRATILHGLDWLEKDDRPGPEDAFLLLPPDHPTLVPEAIQILRENARPPASIWILTYQGQRGHPTLIGWQHVPGIRALPPDQGLNRYLRAQAAETQEVPFPSPDILCDLDTPADYERLLQRFAKTETDKNS